MKLEIPVLHAYSNFFAITLFTVNFAHLMKSSRCVKQFLLLLWSELHASPHIHFNKSMMEGDCYLRSQFVFLTMNVQ